MPPSLKKELQPLLLPWCIAALGGFFGPTDDLGYMLGSLASFGGLAILAATALGSEFQNRTFLLLLSQPCERAQIWNTKLTAVVMAAAGLVFLNWRVVHVIVRWPFWLWMVFWVFLFLAICSSGFWILKTGSYLRGIAIAAGIHFLPLALTVSALRWTTGPFDQWVGWEFSRDVLLCGAIISGAWIWLGREFWKRQTPKAYISLVVFLALSAVAQILFGGELETRNASEETWMGALFVMVTVCSAGFWTLVARSTLGGAVFSVASQFMLATGLTLIASLVYPGGFRIEAKGVLTATIIVAVGYSSTLLYLGWRKFARLETKQLIAGESNPLFLAALGKSSWLNWLRCCPKTGLLNLARKELHLQKPVFTLAAIFFACFIATAVAYRVQPHQSYDNLLLVLLCLYAPLCAVLAGSISLGEEKTMGSMAWHLSLPIATRRQWFVKVGMGATIEGILGILFPWVLVRIGVAISGNDLSDLGKLDAQLWTALSLVSAIMFVLSFWASTLLANTTRSALASVMALVGLGLCARSGNWCAEQMGSFLQDFFLVQAFLFSGLQTLFHSLNPRALALGLFLVGSALVALGQSLSQFRQIQPRNHGFLRSAVLLAFATFFFAFWATDLSFWARTMQGL